MSLQHIGHRFAPARFVMASGLFVAAFVLCLWWRHWSDWSLSAMLAFDVAAAFFLIAIVPVMRRGAPDQMRATSQANDANRTGLLFITVATSGVILVSLIKEMAHPDGWTIAAVLGTLVMSWIFSNVVYALHYAHLYYLPAEDGEDSKGLKFPDCDVPDYSDFLYFSFTLGMTFQTSDVDITSRRIRKIVLGQSLAGFVFNLGVLALTISTIGSLINPS